MAFCECLAADKCAVTGLFTEVGRIKFCFDSKEIPPYAQ